MQTRTRANSISILPDVGIDAGFDMMLTALIQLGHTATHILGYAIMLVYKYKILMVAAQKKTEVYNGLLLY